MTNDDTITRNDTTDDGEEFVSTEPMGQRGETQTVTFDTEPLPAVDTYYSEPQMDSMRGDILRGVSDPGPPSNDTASDP